MARTPHPSSQHRGPSRVTVEWLGGGRTILVVTSGTSSLVQQFDAARDHDKTWVLETVNHRVHVIDPAAVRQVVIARAPTRSGPSGHGSDE